MATLLPPRHQRVIREGGHTSGTVLDAEPSFSEQPLPSLRVTAGLFMLLAAIYTYIGYRVTVNGHVVVFDALDRLDRTFMVWHNNPPKLAAIGFVFPPLTTMAYMPVTIVKPLATSLVAIPLSSAVFAAATVVVLDRTCARCDMATTLRLPLLALFAFNPFWLFYAGNGMSEAIYAFLLATTAYSFISWYVTTQPRFLIGAGFGLSLLVVTRYAFIIWAVLFAVLIGTALIRRGAGKYEVEGSVVAFAAPISYVLALWILFNTLIIGDPLGWLSDATTSTQAVNSTGIDDLGALSFNDVAKRLLELNAGIFPLSFAVIPALLALFITQRNDMALWLAALTVLGIVIIGVHAYTAEKEGLLTLRDSMPMYVVAFIGAAWLFRSLGDLRIGIWALTMALLAINLFSAWHVMKTYPFQSLEQAFTRTLFTGDDQEGRASIGGYRVGIAAEARMAQALKSITPQHKGMILADNAQTFGTLILYGRPQNVFDRIDKGDKKFRQTLERPFGKVDYLLVSTSTNIRDLITQRYPRLLDNAVPGLTPIFRTTRYVLIRVAATQPRGFAAATRVKKAAP